MTTFTDPKSGMPLICGEIPEGFKTDAFTKTETFETNQLIKAYTKAVNGNCSIYYQTGDTYILNKSRMAGFYNHVLGAEECRENGNFMVNSFVDIRQQLDRFGSGLAGKRVEAKACYELSEKLQQKAKREFDRQIDLTLNEMQLGSRISSMPVTTVVRNYLLDGGSAVYEDGGKCIAVCLYRVGLETDLVQGPPTVAESASGVPFAQAQPVFGSIQSQAAWNIPYIIYMVTDDRKDLTAFFAFAESADLTEQFRSYCDQMHQQVVEYQTQMARIQTMQTNAAINTMWAQQQQAWAASDRLRDSISRDLDSFHNNLTQTMAQNDSCIFSAGSGAGESSDDRIQRWRHESTMGVETYERDDGSTVEFDSRADRVFENDLLNTEHFGTHNYFDDYVPDGWHELEKK